MNGRQESEFETEGPSEVIIVLSPRNLKAVLKQSGCRLSSNAFECLNSFIANFLECLGRQINSVMRDEIALHLSVHKSGLQRFSVSWPMVMRCVRTVALDSEAWFSNWQACLNQQTTTNYTAILAEKAALMDAEECEHVLRLALHPVLQTSPLILASVVGAMNDAVQWIVKVAARLAESKGLGTIRRGDMQSILTRAPVFESLHKFLQPAGPTLVDFGELGTNATLDAHPRTVCLEDNPPRTVCPEPSNLEAIPERKLVLTPADSPRRLASSPQEPRMKQPSAPTISNAHSNDTLSISNISYLAGTRIIACTDPDLSWVKCQASRSQFDVEAVIVQSRGVSTDEDPSKADPLQPTTLTSDQTLEKMQHEIDSLKVLIQQLISVQIKSH